MSLLCTRERKLVPVYYHKKPLDSYSVILAKPPQQWKDGPMVCWPMTNLTC